MPLQKTLIADFSNVIGDVKMPTFRLDASLPKSVNVFVSDNKLYLSALQGSVIIIR